MIYNVNTLKNDIEGCKKTQEMIKITLGCVQEVADKILQKSFS